MLRWVVALVVIGGVLLGVCGDRPQLVRATYGERSDQFLGSKYEYIQSAFEFDQDLYLNEPYLCINSENSCPPLDCTPCDWSKPNADSCWDESCCQPPIPVREKEIWCSNSTLHPFTTLKVDEVSPTYKLDAGETQYFRVFLGEEVYCHPVLVSVRSIYGNHQFFLSPVFPEPDYELAYETERRDTVIYRQNQWSFAQSNTLICPGTRIYTPGTYAITITAYEPTAFYFEIFPSPVSHPLPPPEEKITCDSVPDEVYEVPHAAGRHTICLEDGVTYKFDSEKQSEFSDLFDVILPIPAGCHGITMVAQNYISTFTDHDIVCLNLDDSSPLQYWEDYNSALAAWRSVDDNIHFFGCFDQPTFIHCAVQPWEQGAAALMFSTVAPFHRTPILEIPPSILSSQMAIGSITVKRPDVLACGDFHLWCSNWVSSGSPLVFWPAPAIASVIPAHYDPSPTTFLPSEEVDGKKLYFVDATVRGDTSYGFKDSQVEDSIIIFLSITNKDGLPVQISNQTTPFKEDDAALLEYLPHIRYSHQDFFLREKSCNEQEFARHQDLIDNLITSVENSNTNLSSVALPYYVEVFNAENAYVDCLESIISAFPQEDRSLVRSGIECLYAESDPEWETDPCCNVNLQSTQCCQYKSVTDFSSVRVFIEQDQVVCSSDIECAESYFADFLRAYNDQFDGVIGCPSQSPLEQTRFVDTTKQAELKKMRDCLSTVGYGGVDGAQFTGTECDDDSDCIHDCNKEEGICFVSTTKEMESQFLRCWIQTMGTFVEDFIRRKVFDSDEASAHRFSNDFFFSLKGHATQPDCLSPSYPLDFTKRTHTTIKDPLYNSKYALICPGGDLCVYDHAPINSGVIVHDDFLLAEAWVPSSPESCNIAAKCGGCREEGVCVSCVEQKRGTLEECTVQEGLGRDECQVGGACVHPNGKVEYGLTEAECKAVPGECSLCLYDECTTWKPFDGVCILHDIFSESDCSLHSGLWDAGSSLCSQNQSIADCQGPERTWQSCGQFSVEDCGSGSPLQSLLGCQWSSSLSTPCINKEECESGGRCSDSYLLNPLEGGRRGGCAFAGGIIESGVPPDIVEAHADYSGSPLGYLKTWVRSEEECQLEEGTNRWLNEALNIEECIGPSQGRWGCFLPGARFTLAFFYSREDCECIGGEYRAATKWETGEWKKPTFIPFHWNEKELPPKYEWVDAVSFEKMVGWVVDSVQEKSTALTVSSLTCERNFTAATLDWIVCNCLSDSPDECLLSSVPRVATGRVCKGEASELSAPSARLKFQNDSITNGCVGIELGFLSVDGFTYLKKRPSITVQFEKPVTQGL